MQPGWILVNVSNVKRFDVIFNLANIKQEQLFHLRGLCNSRVSLRPLHKKTQFRSHFYRSQKIPKFHMLFFPIPEKAHEAALRSEPYGRTDAEGYHSVLRLRPGETKGPLPQHPLLQTPDQSEHHFLQLNAASRTAGQENH